MNYSPFSQKFSNQKEQSNRNSCTNLNEHASIISILLLPLISVLTSAVLSFAPAVLLTFILHKFHSKKLGMKSNEPANRSYDENWTIFWSIAAQLVLYIAGAITFHRIVFSNQHPHFDGIAKRLWLLNSWEPLIMAFFLGSIPFLTIYLNKFSDLLNKKPIQNNNQKTKCKILLNILGSAILFPLPQFYIAIKNKQISWLLLAILYSVPFVVLITFQPSQKGAINSTVVASHFILWVIGMVQFKKVNIQYKMSEQVQTEMESSEPDTIPNWDSLNPFEVLGLNNSANSSQIKNAYYRLIIKYHPDKFVSLPSDFRKLAEEKTKILNRAHEECLRKKVA